MLLQICPTYETPHCGIAKYARYLYEAIGKLNQEPQVVLGGGLASIHNALLNTKPRICHLQFEYGFAPHERLQLLGEYCRHLGVKLVITYHTLGNMPHNLVPALRLTHTVRSRSILYGNFENIFSPIPIIPIGIPEIEDLQRIKESQSYLFFGQAHPHKGLMESLKAFEVRPDKLLVAIVSKPVAGSNEYYDLCKSKADVLPNILWIDKYLEDSEVLGVAQYCKAAIFPYKEYGSIGVSAAVRLILNLDIPIYCSNVTHFEDIQWLDIVKDFPLETFLDQPLEESKKSIRDAVRWNWSFDKSAQQHMNLYRLC